MRSIHVLFMAVAMAMFPNIGFAQERDECMTSCTSDRESSNTECPSPYDSADYSSTERDRCLEKNQTTYQECVDKCPPPPAPPSSEEQPAPATMGY
jgi:hypothetical protein